MPKEIIVNVGDRETRIAIREDGRLAELHVEREERVVGNIMKGRVDTVRPGMDAAFVDIGLSRNAFLYVGDVLTEGATGADLATNDDEDDDDDDDGDRAGSSGSSRRPRKQGKLLRRSARRQQRISDVLKVGQEVLVQVTKGPRGTKGARVSTLISLPGRYLVLMPGSETVGVSRKITEGKERERLRGIGDRLKMAGFGIIMRTEAEDASEADLTADRDFLLKVWSQIQATAKTSRAPAPIYQDLTLLYRAIRDIFGSDVSRLEIDDPLEYERANELLGMVSPKLRGRVQLYSGTEPIFDHYNIEADIEQCLRKKAWLKSGGYLIIDETEALTVIDVNTGKFTGGHNLSETILRTNIDAAAEISRQLRIRDIGGIIVIDFIDMDSSRDRQQVIKALETALKKDRTRTKISNISPLGLVEMTRKRTDETIGAFLSDTCSHCGGRGKVASAETVSILVERELLRTVAAGKKAREAFLVSCSAPVAELIIGEDGANVDRLEREIGRAVYVRAVADMHQEKYDVTAGDIAEFDRRYCTHTRGQVVDAIAMASELGQGGCMAWHEGYLIDPGETNLDSGAPVRLKLTEIHRSYAVGVWTPHGR